jgi:ribosomal protein S18 acetylase RimI-like enzyme
MSTAPRLVRSWRRVLETLRHGAADGAGTGRGTELLAIAVAPDREGQGIGKALVAAFLGRVAATGATEAYVVVGADNVGAIRLYVAAGFVAGPAFELHAGTRSLLMQWKRAAS